MNEKILQAIKKLKEKSKKRKFPQSFDLIINLKEIDLKKPENKINEDFFLPHGKGKEANVIIFSDTIKNPGTEVLTTADIERLAKNKRVVKTIARRVNFFLAEPKLMPLVGKILGQFIAPRGKMPKLISGDVKSLVENYKRGVKIRIKDSPVIQCPVGTEKMKDEEIVENIEELLKFLETKLPKGKQNIKEVLVKFTMGKPTKIEV